MLDHNFNNVFDVFAFDEFFVVGVHLFREIDAADVLLEVGFGHLQDVLEFLFVVFVVPDQDCEEIVGGVEGPDGHVVVGGKGGHQLQELHDDVVVVLAFDEVLV